MKKFLTISLVVLQILLLVSCGGDKKDSETTDTTPDADTDSADSAADDEADSSDTNHGGNDTVPDSGPENPDSEPEEPEKNAEGCYVFTVDSATFGKVYKNTYYGDVKDNILGDVTERDVFGIDLFQTFDGTSLPGTYDLGGGTNKSYLDCTECVRVWQDHDNKNVRIFFQESGELVIDEVDMDNEIKGTLTAKLIEVTVDPDTREATPVAGGDCIAIENWAFNSGVCVPDCDGKVCGGDGCGGKCGEGCSGELTCSEDQKSCVPFECDEITLGQVELLNDYDTYYYEAYATGRSAGSTDLDDIFNLYFYDENGDAAETLNSGTVVLGSGLNAEYITCTECILFYEDVNEDEEYQKIYFPQSGELVFEEVKEGTMESKGHGHFRLVEVDEFDSFTPVPNGKCYEVKDFQWDTIQP